MIQRSLWLQQAFRNSPIWIGAALVMLMGFGCVSMPAGRTKDRLVEISKIQPPDVYVQYRRPTCLGQGPYFMAEIFWKNRTSAPISVESLQLDGNQLPVQTEEVTWWQFFPDSTVAPGDYLVCRLNFNLRPVQTQEVAFVSSTGIIARIKIPPFSFGGKYLSAITFSHDYRKMFVQYRGGSANPRKIWVNNREINKFEVLASPDEKGLSLVAFKSPLRLATGDPLHVMVNFSDDSWGQAYAKAMNGIVLNAFNMDDPKIRRSLGIDIHPPFAKLDSANKGDVACFDVSHRHQGLGARDFVQEVDQLRKMDTGKKSLTAIFFCRALYPEVWDIYGPLADVAMVSPYSYAYSGQQQYMEEEGRRLDLTARSAAPRPFVWIPETVKYADRFLSPREIEIMTWMALIRGAKGIKYFAYDFNDIGFKNDPMLLNSIQKNNREIRALEEYLCPLVHADHMMVGPKKTISADVAWSGDAGILVFLRDLQYRIEPTPSNGKQFVVEPRDNLVVKLPMPGWLMPKKAIDLTRRKDVIQISQKRSEVTLTVPRFNGAVVIWIPRSYKKWWRGW